VKFLLVKPHNENSITLSKIQNQKRVEESESILIINSMLNPLSKWSSLIKKSFEKDFEKIKIDELNVSQVKKKNILDWKENNFEYDHYAIVVGDCATCTFKASQDVLQLIISGNNSTLYTFQEMEPLIIDQLKNNYSKNIQFIDDLIL
jgi:hypothetical protein